jgi:hypothetical protein
MVMPKAEPGHEPAQLAGIVGCGDHRAAAGAGAGQMAVGIRDPVAALEGERRVLLEELHHARHGIEEGRDPGLVEVVAEHAAQISPGRLRILDDAGPPRERVSRCPHPAAGPGGGAAEHRLLLGQDHLEAMPGGGDGRRQAARTRPDHQEIALDRRRGHVGSLAQMSKNTVSSSPCRRNSIR